MNKEIKDITADQLVYILNNVDCEERAEILGITKKHYAGKQAQQNAKKWYLLGAKKIHPDICKLEGSQEAFSKLNQLYNQMLGNN